MAQKREKRISKETRSISKQADFTPKKSNPKIHGLAVGVPGLLLSKSGNGKAIKDTETRRNFLKKATSAIAVASAAVFFSINATSCDDKSSSDCECEDVGNCSCHQVCTCNKVCTCQYV